MIIGVPKEIKKEEYRVALTPSGARELRKTGHTVLVEAGAGVGSGFGDEEYLQADADILDRKSLFAKADLIVKVKEPLPDEYGLIKDRQAIFTYLHLAANPNLAEFLINKRVTALSYETLEKNGALPLLAPMSEIAGRMAPLVGAHYLQAFYGGTGVLPTGAVGAGPAKAIILGAGVAGSNAARVSIGLGMNTVVLNRGMERLERLDEMFRGRITTLHLSSHEIEKQIADADIVVCAILVPGGKTPVLITRGMLSMMKKGSVIVDISIDQGGCAETSRPTTHDDPVYTVDGVIHYTVANMPGAYPRTSTLSLTNMTLHYVKVLADYGIDRAIRENAEIRSALNLYCGFTVYKALADALGLNYRSVGDICR